jgi:hypothetical protein
MTRRSILSQSYRRILFILFQVVMIGTFIFVLITTTPLIDSLYYYPAIGPISPQAIGDGTNQLHICWGEVYILPNGSRRVVLKYQAPTQNMGPVIISEPFAFYWSPYNTWPYLEDIRTTLTCNPTGNIAIGWIQPISNGSMSPADGRGYFRIYNGTEWSTIQRLPNSNVLSKFQLQYGLNGTLYAFYLNYLTDSQWQLQYWEVGSGLPPITLLDETSISPYYLRRSQLLAGFDGHLYFFCDNYSQDNFGLAFRSYQNGSWSQDEMVTDDTYGLDDWLVVMSPDETIHLVWPDYSGDVHYRYFYNQTWSVATSVYTIRGRLLDLEVDSDNNLQLLGQEYYLPPPGPFVGALVSPFYLLKRIGTSWDSPIQLTDIPTDYSYVDLVMVNSHYSYLVHLQTFHSASQLGYYTIDGSAVFLNSNFYVSTVSEMLFRYQLLLIAKGTIIIFGAMVFLPIVFVFLRRSFWRILR